MTVPLGSAKIGDHLRFHRIFPQIYLGRTIAESGDWQQKLSYPPTRSRISPPLTINSVDGITRIAGEMARHVLAGAHVKHGLNRGNGGLRTQVGSTIESPSPQWLLRIAAAGAVSLSLSLSGCSNSPTNAAAQSAASASVESAHYLATAGDYRPAKNFPDHFTQPLTTTELRMREQSAMRNPSAYLARNGKDFTSSRRDIRHAIALLTNALGNSALSWEYKRVLYAQRAMCEDQLAAIRAGQMRAELSSITRELHALDYSTLHLTRYAKKISYLKAEEKAYSTQYVSALRSARKHLRQSLRVVNRLTGRLHHAEHSLRALLGRRKAELVRGGRLEMQSSIQSGPQSLATLEAGTRQLNAAAALSAPIANGRLAISQLGFALRLAENRASQAKAQVTELSAQRTVSERIARRAADQLKLLHVAVRTIIYGAATDRMDVNRAASEMKTSLAELKKNAAKATALYASAARDFEMAVNSQRTAITVANQLINQKMRPSDPLVKAFQDRTPAALLEILQAGSTLADAQMLRTQLMAQTLQQAAAWLCKQTYGLIGKQSPIAAPPSGYLATLRKNVILKMDSATMAIRQAKNGLSEASSRVKWLQPAYLYAVNVGIAGTATESAMVAKAEAVANEAAKAANAINPSLNLPTLPVH